MIEGKAKSRRTPGLKGYRPEEGTISSMLRPRRTRPVHPRLSVETELWLCVQFVTNEDVGITHLRNVAGVARPQMAKIFYGWGIDVKSRSVVPTNETEAGILKGTTTREEKGPLAA